MRSCFAAVTIAVAAGLFALPAVAAEISDLSALDANAGTKEVYSCYSRQYDAAHLQNHPKQNVTDIKVFVDSSYDETWKHRTYQIEMGVSFRGLKHAYEVSGDCATVDGEKSLACGVDCDGGQFNIGTQDVSTLLLSIPNSVRIWDPTDTSDDGPGDTNLPKAASFGDDDKDFKLDKVDVKECQSLMNDDQKTAILASK